MLFSPTARNVHSVNLVSAPTCDYYVPMSSPLAPAGARLNNIFRPNGHVFYGWWIVLACAGVQWLAALTWMHSYGGYALKLQADFGWSMSVLSLAFALTRLESGLLGPLQGWLVDRYGPRRILIIGTLIFAVGFFTFSMVESITTYFVAFILIALGSSLGGFATLMVSIVSWFDAHRAKAVAMSQIGFSAGGLCVPFVMMGLEAFGWRSMALYSGILILVVGLPLVSLVRHRPEDYGEVPDGIRAQDDDGKNSSSTDTQISLSWRQAVKEPSFWLISSGHALSLLTVSSMLAHLIPYLTFDLGYEPVNAGFVFALMVGVVVGTYSSIFIATPSVLDLSKKLKVANGGVVGFDLMRAQVPAYSASGHASGMRTIYRIEPTSITEVYKGFAKSAPKSKTAKAKAA